MADFQNPTPVVVGVVPVWTSGLVGLLLVRRRVEPGVGLLALPGGFLELEPWRIGLARELHEETGIDVEPDQLHPLAFESSEPVPSRLLCFGELREWLEIDTIPPFVPNPEVSEIGLVYRCDGLEDQIAFPLHFEQIRAWFDEPDNMQHDAPVGFHPLS